MVSRPRGHKAELGRAFRASAGGGSVHRRLSAPGDAIDDGEALPAPRSVEALRADPEFAATLAEGAALAIVPLLLDSGRAVRANRSLGAGLLDAIDEAAKAHGLTRSAFLASAARIGLSADLCFAPIMQPKSGEGSRQN
jgi:hypothetical protein